MYEQIVYAPLSQEELDYLHLSIVGGEEEQFTERENLPRPAYNYGFFYEDAVDLVEYEF